jgi:hypothetical protein
MITMSMVIATMAVALLLSSMPVLLQSVDANAASQIQGKGNSAHVNHRESSGGGDHTNNSFSIKNSAGGTSN